MEQQQINTRAPSSPAYSVARGLGWLSLGLGAAQLLIPGVMNRALGVSGKKWMTRSCGAREVVAGLGLFASRRPAPWLWIRSAGDAADLAALAALARRGRRGRNVALVAFAAVAGITALDLMAARQLQGKRWPVRPATHDYGNRSGFNRPPEAMRGVAAGAGRETGGERNSLDDLPRPTSDTATSHTPSEAVPVLRH